MTPTPQAIQQVEMNFDPEIHARRSDPATSHGAAKRAGDFASTQAGRILLALQKHGPLNAHDVGEIVGLTVVQVDRRFPDLKALGLARVKTMDDGADLVRDGFRVWEAIQR